VNRIKKFNPVSDSISSQCS